MRQRGAGTRDIVLAFNLELPGLPPVSKTPLRPQKSVRSRKDALPELQPLQSTRKTPKAATVNAPLFSKSTPKTTRPRKIKALAGEVTIGDAVVPDNVLHDDEVVLTKKRKRKATEDVIETPAIAPPKKQRKRGSIGQETSKKKARLSLASSGPPNLRKATTRSKQARHVDANIDEDATAQQDVATQELPSSKPVLDVQEQEEEKRPISEKPRRRKRKSIGQTQRRKAKPVNISLTIPLDKSDPGEEAQASTKVEEPMESAAIETRTKVKPQRKRKAIAQSPKKRKKISPPKKSPSKSGEVEERRRSSREEPGKDLSLAVATIEEKPVKQGRKPKAIEQASLKTAEIVSEITSKIPEPKEASAKISLAEAQAQAEPDCQVPNRRGRKRKSIGQVQRPRKKRKTEAEREVPPDAENTGAKVEPIIQASEVKIASGTKRKRPVKKHPESFAAISENQQEPAHDNLLTPQAPKKRGRPKKAAISVDVELPVIAKAGQYCAQQADVEMPPKNLRRKRRAAPVPSHEPVSKQEPTLQPPLNVKKRGRPRKQDLKTSTVEHDIGTLEPHSSSAKSTRSNIRVKNSLAEMHKPPTSSLPQKPIKVASAITHIIHDEDDDDPLSDLAPLHTKTRPTTKRTAVPKPGRKHIDPGSNLSSTALINTNKSPSPNPKQKPIPTSDHSAPAQHAHDNKPSEQPAHTTTATTTTDALITHIHTSREEELALRADLQELHAQQAHELAEQKQRDLAARLESLSRSVKKRKMESRMKGMSDRDRDGAREKKGEERRVGRGLENFVFRTAGKGKRKVVDGGGEDDIDPELQALLSRVKGVSAGGVGGAGLMGVF